jgi:3-oxoacyl-[acyl-carrier protein] reductase
MKETPLGPDPEHHFNSGETAVENLMLSNSIRAAASPGSLRRCQTRWRNTAITVNNILPGYTATERVQKLAETLAAKEGVNPAEVRSRWESEIPMKRLGNPKEFAALAAFLVSERASYITGSSIAVDGGWIRSIA